jgi:hypothetical protein
VAVCEPLIEEADRGGDGLVTVGRALGGGGWGGVKGLRRVGGFRDLFGGVAH